MNYGKRELDKLARGLVKEAKKAIDPKATIAAPWIVRVVNNSACLVIFVFANGKLEEWGMSL